MSLKSSIVDDAQSALVFNENCSDIPRIASYNSHQTPYFQRTSI